MPDLTEDERISYLSAEIDKVLEMLDGAEDCKWIYQALIHMSNLYYKIAGERPSQASTLEEWLQQLERIDTLRAGRWQDVSSVRN